MPHRKKSIVVLTALSIAAPALLSADCLPSGPSNYTVPFSLVTLKNFSSGGSQYASWAKGSLTITNTHTIFDSGITLATSGIQQLFSDRIGEVDCSGPNSFCTAQPFNVNQADQLGVSVSRNYSLLTPSTNGEIIVTLTLQSWGNAKETYVGTCDATSGELTYTSSTGMGMITFGTPVAPPTAQ